MKNISLFIICLFSNILLFKMTNIKLNNQYVFPTGSGDEDEKTYPLNSINQSRGSLNRPINASRSLLLENLQQNKNLDRKKEFTKTKILFPQVAKNEVISNDFRSGSGSCSLTKTSIPFDTNLINFKKKKFPIKKQLPIMNLTDNVIDQQTHKTKNEKKEFDLNKEYKEIYFIQYLMQEVDIFIPSDVSSSDVEISTESIIPELKLGPKEQLFNILSSSEYFDEVTRNIPINEAVKKQFAIKTIKKFHSNIEKTNEAIKYKAGQEDEKIKEIVLKKLAYLINDKNSKDEYKKCLNKFQNIERECLNDFLNFKLLTETSSEPIIKKSTLDEAKNLYSKYKVKEEEKFNKLITFANKIKYFSETSMDTDYEMILVNKLIDEKNDKEVMRVFSDLNSIIIKINENSYSFENQKTIKKHLNSIYATNYNLYVPAFVLKETNRLIRLSTDTLLNHIGQIIFLSLDIKVNLKEIQGKHIKLHNKDYYACNDSSLKMIEYQENPKKKDKTDEDIHKNIANIVIRKCAYDNHEYFTVTEDDLNNEEKMKFTFESAENRFIENSIVVCQNEKTKDVHYLIKRDKTINQSEITANTNENPSFLLINSKNEKQFKPDNEKEGISLDRKAKEWILKQKTLGSRCKLIKKKNIINQQ